MKTFARPAPDTPLPIGRTGDRFEREADRAADAVMAGRAPPAVTRATGPAIRCEKTDEEKLKEGAKAVAKGVLKTDAGKKVLDTVKESEPVKAATETPAGIATLATLGAGALTGFAVAGKDPPEIPAIPIKGIDFESKFKGFDGKGEFGVGLTASWPINADFSFGKEPEKKPQPAKLPTPIPRQEDLHRGPGVAPDVRAVAEQAAARLAAQRAVDIDAIIARTAHLKESGMPPLIQAPAPFTPKLLPELQLDLKKLEEAGALRRSADSGAATPDHAPPVVHQTLGDPGEPLAPAVRAFMEQRFEADFPAVRVHADRRGADAARSVGARAWSVGEHLAFAEGQYRPDHADGRRLLAHELAHVVQSRRKGR